MNGNKAKKVTVILFLTWVIVIYLVASINSYFYLRPKYPQKSGRWFKAMDIVDINGDSVDEIPCEVADDAEYLVLFPTEISYPEEEIVNAEWFYYSPSSLLPEYDFIPLSAKDPVSHIIHYEEMPIEFITASNGVKYKVPYKITMIDRHDLTRGNDGQVIPGFHKDAFRRALMYRGTIYIGPSVVVFIAVWFLFFLYYKEKSRFIPVVIIAYIVLYQFYAMTSYIAKAPVIYLYPEQQQDISVELDINGSLMTTYPVYDNGWQVTAYPDGTLLDANGRTYDYLFWEANLNINPDFSEGFCVAGKDTADFLEDALHELGLTDSEADTFIMYWLPQMISNDYNVISFQTDRYEDAARLNVSPNPDSEIRVFMTFYSVPYEVNISEQDLSSLNNIDRDGFTLVEWGGAEISSINGELRRITN